MAKRRIKLHIVHYKQKRDFISFAFSLRLSKVIKSLAFDIWWSNLIMTDEFT